LLTRRTLGLVTEVHHGPGVYCGPPDVYRGPPEVYRGPCMKNMCWNRPIYPTSVGGDGTLISLSEAIYYAIPQSVTPSWRYT